MENICQTVNELQSVTWRDELVLTTAQLAEFYETSVETVWQNFKRNRDRFVEDKHFFILVGRDIENLRMTICQAQTGNNPSNCQAQILRVKNCQAQISSKTRVLYLWTKRGAARHAKMLNTDRAWEVFEALEDNYFNRTAENPIGYNDTIPGADFWFEVKQPRQPSDFRRGVELKKLASHTRNPELRERLILEAASLIAGKEILIH